MTDFFAIEDGDNVRKLLLHHLGHPWETDDDGRPLGLLAREAFETLERDLLRYCTRLRCQPDTTSHVSADGYRVPQHQLVRERR